MGGRQIYFAITDTAWAVQVEIDEMRGIQDANKQSAADGACVGERRAAVP